MNFNQYKLFLIFFQEPRRRFSLIKASFTYRYITPGMRIPFLGENHSNIGGTKMKRIAAILLAVLALLFGACSVQRYSDAAMFCRRFNREYKESLLDIEAATVTETDGCTVFSLTPDENILISLYTDSDGVRIKRISITAHGNVEEMQNGLFARFLAFCKCAVPAYSNDEDTYENISAKLNIPNENEYATAITQYTQGEAVRYAYSADVAGAFFCMESKSLCRESEEHLTLRDDGTELKS